MHVGWYRHQRRLARQVIPEIRSDIASTPVPAPSLPRRLRRCPPSSLGRNDAPTPPPMPVMPTVLMPMVPMMNRSAPIDAFRLGDPLRGRALRCNLATLDFRCDPCRLRSRSARYALRLPKSAARRADATETLPGSARCTSCLVSSGRDPVPQGLSKLPESLQTK